MIINDVLIKADGTKVNRQITVADNYFDPPTVDTTPTIEDRITALETKYTKLNNDLTAVKTSVSFTETPTI